MKSERAPVTDGPAEDSPKDVPAPFVARLNAIGDGEAERADVIRDHPEGDVDLFLLVGGQASSLTRPMGILPVGLPGRLEARRPRHAGSISSG